MRSRFALTLVCALPLAAVDLVVDHLVATPAWDLHRRTHAWVAVATVLLVVVAVFAVLPSGLVAAAAGIVAGGILGNLVSALEDARRVPNPLVLGTTAFNLADLCVLAGIPLLVVGLARVAIVHREHIDRHIPPRRWERALRRRLGL